MTNAPRFPRFLGCWEEQGIDEVSANVWQTTNGSFVAVVHIHNQLTEAVEVSALDDLLSYLASSYGNGQLWIAKPNESVIELDSQ